MLTPSIDAIVVAKQAKAVRNAYLSEMLAQAVNAAIKFAKRSKGALSGDLSHAA